MPSQMVVLHKKYKVLSFKRAFKVETADELHTYYTAGIVHCAILILTVSAL